ncbi:hypothetical protein BDZ97DRAFT_1841616 [Flammula alnicola]|nr:hypothetical protein BDZ97DRAFT_1841616 [Flammula alnicola]
MKAKGTVLPPGENTDSDAEFIDMPTSPRKRRRINQMAPSCQRPQLSIVIPTSPSVIDLSDSPSSIPSFSPFPSLSPLLSPSSSVASPSPKTPRWPQKRYAVDIVAGFYQMDELSLLDERNHVRADPSVLSSRLADVFGCNIPHSTYYDARSRWDKASQALRDKVTNGGRTPSGLWSYLASRVPLKSVPLKD